MTVLARSKAGAVRIRRRRAGQSRITEHPETRTAGRDLNEQTTMNLNRPTTTADVDRRLREAGGGSEDEAVYTCSCGFVFSALVSTSVDCPHCGGSQAW